MARPYLIFRGVSTDTLGLIVTKMPEQKKAQARVTKYNIPGRDGELHITEGYAAYDVEARVSMWQQNANIRNVVNAWADGTGKLVSSDDLSRCWTASVIDEVEFTRRSHHNGTFFDEAVIRFRCQPIMRESVETVLNISGTTTLINGGDVETLPLIKVTGTGNCGLTVAGTEISLTGVQRSHPVFVDSDAGYVYTDQGSVSMTGEFPVIPLGTSQVTISGGTTALEVTPRWGWL